jgi:hypothetical protein
MAFELNKPKVDKTVEAAQQRQTQLTTGAGSSGEGAQAATGIGPAQPQSSAPKFTNIQSVLNANKGAGQALTGTIGNKIGSEIQEGSQAVGKASGNVGDVASAIQRGKDALTTTLGSLNPPAAAPTGGAHVEQAGTTQGTNTQGNTTQSTGTPPADLDPNAPKTNTGYTSTPQPNYKQGTFDPAYLAGNKTDLDWLTGFTTGKTQTQQDTDLKAANRNLSDIGTLTQKQAQGRLTGFGSAEGRQGMLEEMIAQGNANYGRGASSLDQAFMQLQGKPFFNQQRQALQKQQQNLGGLITSGTEAGKTAGTTLGESQKLSTDVLGALGKGETSLVGEEDTRAADVAAKNIKANQVLEDFRNGGYAAVKAEDKAQLNSLLGNAVKFGEHTYGLNNDDLVGYINKGAEDIGRKDVITPEELQKYQMLRRLQGRDIEGSDVAFTKAGDPTKSAGFDSKKLRAELDRREAEFQNDASSTLAYTGTKGWSGVSAPTFQTGTSEFNPITGYNLPSGHGDMHNPSDLINYLNQLTGTVLPGDTGLAPAHSTYRDYGSGAFMSDLLAHKAPTVTGSSVTGPKTTATNAINAMNSPGFPKNQSGLVYHKDLAGLTDGLSLSPQDIQELQQGVSKVRASEIINNAASTQTKQITDLGDKNLQGQLDAFLKKHHYDTTFGNYTPPEPTTAPFNPGQTVGSYR